jgi:protein ImuA
MSDSHASIARLRRRLERLEPPRHAGGAALFSAGGEMLDARLDGGLARGALHELCAALESDHASASGFALILAMLAAGDKPILWVRESRNESRSGQIYGPGLVELGGDPDQIILVNAPDTLSALRAGADILGCMGLGAVVIEPFGAAKALDLTASRKLVLAAERSGAAAFILRDGTGSFSSAASSRWTIASASSALLPGDAPGLTSFTVDLVRHRGGIAPFSMTVEWDHDQRVFRSPALSRAVLPLSERGQMAA